MSNGTSGLSIRERINGIVSSYLSGQFKVSSPPKPVEIEPTANMVRVAVTQDFIADTLAAMARGESEQHPAQEHFIESLCSSIEAMVNMLASRYTDSCRDGQKDLVQDCMVRIWKKIHLFDSKKGSFTTWSWWVCGNMLKTRWRKSGKIREHEVVQPEDGEACSTIGVDDRESRLLRNEIAQSVRELLKAFPSYRNLIIEMFGNPEENEYVPPPNVCISQCANATGMRLNQVSVFYRTKVIPFMQARLCDSRKALRV